MAFISSRSNELKEPTIPLSGMVPIVPIWWMEGGTNEGTVKMGGGTFDPLPPRLLLSSLLILLLPTPPSFPLLSPEESLVLLLLLLRLLLLRLTSSPPLPTFPFSCPALLDKSAKCNDAFAVEELSPLSTTLLPYLPCSL
jgi:hypothetical protein